MVVIEGGVVTRRGVYSPRGIGQWEGVTERVRGQAGNNLPAAAAKPWSNLAVGAGDTLGDDHDLSYQDKSDDGDESNPRARLRRAILF